MKLSAVVVIRNEAPHLVPFFEHLKLFCDEIIVIDQQSTDNSLQLAMIYADEVYISPQVGWNELDKGYGVGLAKNDWVVILDPDERFSQKAILYLEKALRRAEEEKCDAISFKVQNFWDGIPVEYGSIEQYRIVKKGIQNTIRIHSNFNPKVILHTTLIQLHLKELNKHEKRLAKRQKLDYKDEKQETIKKTEVIFFEQAKVAIEKEKDYWENKRKKIFEQLKPNSMLRLKHNETK